MIKGIAHLCIRVADLEATRRFYCDTLGLEKAFDFIRDGQTVGFYLKAGDHNYLEFFKTDKVATGESPIGHLCLEVDSIDKVLEKVKKDGYSAGEKKIGSDQSWQAWLADPDGVRIELHEYTPQSSQLTGNNCILK